MAEPLDIQRTGEQAAARVSRWVQTNTRDIAREWDRTYGTKSLAQFTAQHPEYGDKARDVWSQTVRHPSIDRAIVTRAVNERVISTNVALRWERQKDVSLAEYAREEAVLRARHPQEHAQSRSARQRELHAHDLGFER
jgi:hypothetical protein